MLPNSIAGFNCNLNLELMSKVWAENEAIRKIALTSTSEETAKCIYKSILEFSSQIGENY